MKNIANSINKTIKEKNLKAKIKNEESYLKINVEGKTPRILDKSPDKPIKYIIEVKKEKENLYSIDIYATIYSSLSDEQKTETVLNTLNQTLSIINSVINPEDKEEGKEYKRFMKIVDTGDIELNKKETIEFLQAVLEEVNSNYYNEKVFEDFLVSLGILTG